MEKSKKPKQFFNQSEFKEYGKKMIDLVCELKDELTAGKHPVTPKIKPGDIRKQLPKEIPKIGESLEVIMEDTKNIIFKNQTHWSHPNFFSYFPSNSNSAGVVSEIFSKSFHNPGFDWKCGPANTELETVVSDWTVKALGLPETFLFKNSGGGIIMNTITESLYIAVHTAKMAKIKELGLMLNDPKTLKFVGYYTELGHCSNHKAMYLNYVFEERVIQAFYDKEKRVVGINMKDVEEQIESDVKAGLIPFFFGLTIGGTSLGATDPITNIIKVISKYKMFINVDAAWAGTAFFVPKHRQQLPGLQQVDSFLMNYGKWGMCGMPGAMMLIKNRDLLIETMEGKVEKPQYVAYQTKEDQFDAINYEDWIVGFGRTWSSLRLWYVLRSVGIEGMQRNINEKIELAQYFVELLDTTDKFEIFIQRQLALVCFQYVNKEDTQEVLNEKNGKLLRLIDEDTSKGFIMSANFHGHNFLRFVVCNHCTQKHHIKQFFHHICKLADSL